MSTAFLVDSLLHAQQTYTESQLKSSLSEMLLSRRSATGTGTDAADPADQPTESCGCSKLRGYKCDKCREIRAESVESIEEMDEDDGSSSADEIVADIGSVEGEEPHMDLDEELEEELADVDEPVSIKLPKVEPKETSMPTVGNTILKDTNSKPILKFSVSAILGDTREGVRVRNGKTWLATSNFSLVVCLEVLMIFASLSMLFSLEPLRLNFVITLGPSNSEVDEIVSSN